MSMDCHELRNRLLAIPANPAIPETPEISAHLAACPRCTAFARRLALARGELRRQGCEVVPDGGFAARVAARLPRRQVGGELLGWAALRALPAALLLALVLAGLAAAETSQPDSLLVDEPSASQLLAWSAQAPEAAR